MAIRDIGILGSLSLPFAGKFTLASSRLSRWPRHVIFFVCNSSRGRISPPISCTGCTGYTCCNHKATAVVNRGHGPEECESPGMLEVAPIGHICHISHSYQRQYTGNHDSEGPSGKVERWCPCDDRIGGSFRDDVMQLQPLLYHARKY